MQSTERSLATSKEERQTLEQTLANQASQLSTLQTQLSSAKAAYETETTLLSTLKERRSTQIADITKTREELIRAESDLSAIRVEKTEVEGVFLRDKEEARDLHRRMVEAGQQAESLKADVDKLKKEAKQQKGLLAIARKQLSTKEAERAKAEKEHEEAVAELTSVNEEKNAVEADIAALDASPIPEITSPVPRSDSLAFAAAQPIPTTPDLAQPVRNNSNNPFERLAMSSGASTPRSQSPFLGLQHTIISSPPPGSINGFTPEHTAEVFKVEPPRPGETTGSIDGRDLGMSFLDEDPAPHGAEGVFSPNTDAFMTPPTSATPLPNDETPDAVAAKFPSLDEIPPSDVAAKAPSPTPAPVAPISPTAGETDFNIQLKELDIEESDSDSDSGDEIESAGPAIAAPGQPTTNGKATSPFPPAANGTNKDAVSPAPIPAAPADSFDDIFGEVAPQEKVPVQAKTTTPFDAFISDSDHSKESSVSQSSGPVSHVAGVSEFDEALGKKPSTTATPVNFTFDDAFDDNFDFNSAKAVGFPPVSAPATAPVPAAAPTFVSAPAKVPDASEFDNIFGTSGTSAAPAPALTSPPALFASNGNAPKVESSFDEVFAVLDTPKPFESPVALPAPRMTEQIVPGAFPSQPSSPVAVAPAPRVANIRAASPTPRERSRTPPPRVISPKPRVSSSSSKEQERPKEPPQRHSKLSVSSDNISESSTCP